MKKIAPILIVLLWAVSVSAQSTNPYAELGGLERSVRDYAFRSIDDPPIPGCSLFAGSSSFAIWGRKLEEKFASLDAVNRGFGGSHISQNVVALDRIHLPYKPSRIVMFCGTNDIASGKNAETVFQDFRYYIARHWNENPLAEIYYVAVTHAPSREKFWPEGDRLCEKVKELASKTEGLYFIDIITPMKGEDGRVREDLFVQDRLHLNDAGYAIWAETFQKAFEEHGRTDSKRDIRKLFENRKELGLFDDPRFERDKIAIKQPPQRDLKLNIVFIGDSITIGGGEQSPPNRCAEYLKKQAGIGEVVVANVGLSGRTTVDFLPSPDTEFKRVVEAADKMKDDSDGRLVFSIMLGTNDSAISGTNGAPVSPENYRKNMKSIVDKLLADYPGSWIILHRPVWYSPNTQNNSAYLLEGQLRSISYLPELESLVECYSKTSDLDRVFLGDTKAFHFFKTHHKDTMHHEEGKKGTFFLHPNQRGADVLGRFWGAAIQDVVCP